ncbi:MAG: hypothetical protein ACREN5_11670 [Gemmatimonadales bacterium]
MKKFTDTTARMILAPVAVSLALAYEPVDPQADEYRPHPDHSDERPSSAPERFVGKPSVIIPTSTDATVLWPSPWPPLPPPDRPSTPFTLA